MQKVDPGKSLTTNLPAGLFSAVRLARVRVRFRILRCRFLRKGTLLMARGRPPPILKLRQFTHLRALLRASSMLAMAVAYRRPRT
jgi:hypothetical protein